MKPYIPYLFAAASLILGGCSCSRCQSDSDVVSKRYIHKYGYDVSQAEWDKATYPGKVITTMRDGTIVTSSYEDGLLHGETTTTYPHSQTVESISTYERGTLISKKYYSLQGIPEKEDTFLSPSHRRTIYWYKSGTPLSLEEYRGKELIEGEYYNTSNEVEYKVTKGEGVRIHRDEHGNISLRETISHGYPILKETFYPHGIPHTVIPLLGNEMHGEKKVYARTGEPLSSETYCQNMLDGKALYYQNGFLYLELNYKEGLKHGIERHFVDGKTVVEETEWYEGKKHGSSTVYFDGMSQTKWYYNDQPVSKDKYLQLSMHEDNIAIMNERALHIDSGHVTR